MEQKFDNPHNQNTKKTKIQTNKLYTGIKT